MVTVGLTLLVTAAAAFIAYERFEILLAVPIAVVILWSVGSRMLDEFLYLAAYKDYSEQQLLTLGLGSPQSNFAVWHSFAGDRLVKGLNNVAFCGVLIFITVCLIAGSLYIAITELPHLYPWVIAESAFVVLAVVLVLSSTVRRQIEMKSIYVHMRAELDLHTHEAPE